MWRVSVGGWLRNIKWLSSFQNRGGKNPLWCWHRLAFFSRHTDQQHSHWKDSPLLNSTLEISPHNAKKQKLYTFSLILFFGFFLQSSHLFMAFFIFSTLPSPSPLLMHFFLSIFSVTMTLQLAIFTLSKYDESFSSVLFGFCLSCLFVDVVCISETRGVCAAKVVKNRSRKQKTLGWNEGLCACVWLMLGISGATRC